MINKFKSILSAQNLNPKNYALDTSMTMSLYGLREAKDIDYLTTEKIIKTDQVEHHQSELPYHGVAEAELVHNPRYHFWYSGIKFISLDQIACLKKNRKEAKDIQDLELINPVLDPDRRSVKKLKSTLLYNWAKTKQNLLEAIIWVTRITGFFYVARRIYRKFLK